MSDAVAARLAALIDHTCLRPEARASAVARLCEEAVRLGCATVCVNPRWVEHAAALLTGSRVDVCTVAGFPLGATTTVTKATEAERSVRDGAREVDMVIDLGGLFDGRHASVRSDIAGVRTALGSTTLKVILETALLDAGQIRTACELAVDAGADFVKTSTGFGPGGATEEAVRLMRECVGPGKGVKASGGIRDLATAQRMIAAGADRLGTSATVSILEVAGDQA
jgi:deoxyribose-phosphate aldolase